MYFAELIAVAAIGTVALLVLRGAGPLVRAWAARHPRIAEVVPPLLLVAGVCWLLWPLLLGRMPYSHDHSAHLTRAWIFVDRMLGEGRLTGWTDIWFAGFPSGDDYPLGGDLLVSSVYLLTFGALGWKASYAIAYLISHAAWVLAPYALARVHFDRTTALLAGLFTLIDAGATRQWGWQFAVEIGVWPQSFAIGFVLYYFAALEGLIRRGRRRDWVLTAGTLGFSLIAHPFSVIWVGLGLPAFLVARTLLGEGRRGPMFTRTFAATALGIALSAFWLVPFVANTEWFQRGADLWLDLDAIAGRMVTGTVYDHLFPPIFFLALVGAALGVRKRQPAAVWLFILAGVTLFVSSKALVIEADLIDRFASLGRILFERFAYIVRPCIALLAAYALGSFLQLRVPWEPLWRRVALAAVVMIVVAPFVLPLARVFDGAYRAGHGLTTPDEIPDWHDYEAFLRWSRAEQDREERFYRIAYVDQGHFLASAPVWNETPAIRTEFTPATTFAFKPSRLDPDLFRVLNVKYVVATRPLADTRHYRPLRSFGRFRVYELVDYTDSRATVIGAGRVEVRRFDPERGEIRFRVTGADGRGQVVLHLARYDDWHVTRDGREVPHHFGELASEDGWLAIDAVNGTYEVRYARGGSDWIGNVVTWLALLLIAALCLRRFAPARIAPAIERLGALGRAVEDRGTWLGAAAAVLAIAAVVAKLLGGPPIEERSFTSQLPRARAEIVRPDGRRTPCERDERGRLQCSAAEWNYVGRAHFWMLDHDGVHLVDGAIRRCIWMHPVANGEVRVTFPDVRLGRSITGEHGLQNRGPHEVELVAYAGEDGEEIGRVSLGRAHAWTPWEMDTRARAGQVVDLTFGVRVPVQGPYHYCWEGQIER